jgi:hypothetical protein
VLSPCLLPSNEPFIFLPSIPVHVYLLIYISKCLKGPYAFLVEQLAITSTPTLVFITPTLFTKNLKSLSHFWSHWSLASLISNKPIAPLLVHNRIQIFLLSAILLSISNCLLISTTCRYRPTVFCPTVLQNGSVKDTRLWTISLTVFKSITFCKTPLDINV